MPKVRGRFLSGGVLLSLALLVGRLAGFVRELLLASSLGLSANADVAIVLLTLPDLLVNLLLSGGLSIALVPALRNAKKENAAALFQQASIAVAVLFSLMALAFVLAPSFFLGAMAPGIHLPLAIKSSGVLLALGFALPLTALSGVSASALNASNRFFVAGCGTLIFNLCIIVGLLSVRSTDQILVMLCWAILFGAALRWLSQLVAIPEIYRHRSERGLLLDMHLLRTFFAGLTASSLLLLVPVVVRAFASMLGVGQIAAFNYANKLVELPLGILITTLATVAYPRMCELFASDQATLAMQELQQILQRATLLSIAVVIPGIWFADSVVTLLFLRGNITVDAVGSIVRLMRIALLTIPCVGISSLAAATLNAQGKTSTVLKITFFCLGLLPLLCLPGIFLNSGVLLISGMVAFHILYAFALSRFAGIVWFGTLGLLNSRMVKAVFIVVVASSLFAMADDLLSHLSHVFRAGIALLAFMFAAGMGLRTLTNNRVEGIVL